MENKSNGRIVMPNASNLFESIKSYSGNNDIEIN